MSDAIKALSAILKEARLSVCICFLCSHKQEYGYCYACQCHNNTPEPDKDSNKLMATVEYYQKILIASGEELKRLVLEKNVYKTIVEELTGVNRA